MFELFIQWEGCSEYKLHKGYRTLQAAWMAFHRMRKTHAFTGCEIIDQDRKKKVAEWKK